MSSERVCLRRLARRAFGCWWDRLGVAVSISMAWALAAGLVFAVATQAPPILRWPLVVVGLAVAGGLHSFAAARLAHGALLLQDVSWADALGRLRGAAPRALRLGLCQAVGIAVPLVGIVFYVAMPWAPARLLALACGLALLHWLAQCCYHWPLLIAAEEGLIQRDGGEGRPRVRAALRNALLLTVTQQPTLWLAMPAAGALLAGLVVSGIGAVLVAPGLAAFLSGALALERLAAVGMVTLPPDPGDPVIDAGWPGAPGARPGTRREGR